MNVLLKTFLLAGILCELSVDGSGYQPYPAPQPQSQIPSFGVNLGTAFKEGGEAISAFSSLFGGAPQPQPVVPPVPRIQAFSPPSPAYGQGNYSRGYSPQSQQPYASSMPAGIYPNSPAGYDSYTPSYPRPTTSLGYAPQTGGYDNPYRVPASRSYGGSEGYEDPSPAPQSYGGYDDPYHAPAPQSYGGYDHPGRASVPDPEYYEPSDQSGRGAGFEDPNALPYGQDTGVDSGEMGDGYQYNSPNPYGE